MRYLAIFAFLLSLPSCFSMTKSDCDSADWRGQGERDGRAGRPRDQGGWYPAWARACAKHPGLEAHRAQYDLGLRSGLDSLCTAASLRAIGQAGDPFPSACAHGTALDGAFRAGVQQHELDVREQSLRRREAQVKTREDNLDRQERQKNLGTP